MSSPPVRGEARLTPSKSQPWSWRIALSCVLVLGMVCPAGAQIPDQPAIESGAQLPASQVVVERVRFEGVRLSRILGLSTRVRVETGSVLDENVVERARLHLLSTGLFERVHTRLERGSARGRVIVIFECTERVTTSLDAFHLGLARPAPFWAGLELSDLDPVGVGVGGDVGFVVAEEQHAVRVGLRMRDPGPLDGLLRLSGYRLKGKEPMVGPIGQVIEGEAARQVFLPYARTGGAVGMTFDLDALLRAHVELTVEHIKATPPTGAEAVHPGGVTHPFDFQIDPDSPLHMGLEGGLFYDSRDDPAWPRRGMRASVHGRLSHQGTFYGKAIARIEHYFPLFFGHTLRVDALAGAITGGAPFFEQFFVGDLHPYIPARSLGLNFSRRRGPQLTDGRLDTQRYETLAGRLGGEYRIPLGKSGSAYGTEFFVGGALLTLSSPGDEPVDAGPWPPFDAVIDFGLRFETEIGVMGLSVGNIFLLVDP